MRPDLRLTALLLALAVMPAWAQRAAFPARASTLGAIPAPLTCDGTPGPPREITFEVAGVPGPIGAVALELTATHAFVGDLDAELIAPTGMSAPVFTHTGIAGGADPFWGANAHLDGTYRFTDAADDDWDDAAEATRRAGPVLASGTYRAPLAAMFFGAPANGVWTLRLTDRCESENGEVTAAVLRLTPLVTVQR